MKQKTRRKYDRDSKMKVIRLALRGGRTKKCAVLLFISLLFLPLFTASSHADLDADFVVPPNQLKTVTLYHMNASLTTELLQEQVQAMQELSGFAGCAPLPMNGMSPAYLTEEYFQRYADLLLAEKDAGMVHTIYDDYGFPSGTAGGRMRQLYPEHTTRYLDMAAEDVAGPAQYQTTITGGPLMGCVAMDTNTRERLDITSEVSGGTLNWTVPAGDWKVMCFTCVDPGADHVNYLSAEGTARLIELTYEQYWTHFSDYFGSTIKMGFYDDISFAKSEGYQQWIDNYNEQFILKNGYNPITYYPALWYDIGEDTEAARAALFGFRSHLMANAYPRVIAEWCTAHGILSTGHAQGAYKPTPVDLGGDAMKFYKYSTAPMVDAIHYYGHGRDGFRIMAPGWTIRTYGYHGIYPGGARTTDRRFPITTTGRPGAEGYWKEAGM
jgi:hypothetical protein